MTAGRSEPEAVSTGSPSLVLEIASQEGTTPLLIPVSIQNLSLGGVTLAVANPWVITDWDHYRGRDCALRVEGPSSLEDTSSKIKAHITWHKLGGEGQPPLLLGVQLAKPVTRAVKQLSNHLAPTSQDIKGLWDRYDQVKESRASSNLVYHCYLVGLGLLIGGLLLQFTGSTSYKMFGWILWFLGSLGIAGKIMRSFRQNRVSP